VTSADLGATGAHDISQRASFTVCDPAERPASDLLAAMTDELNRVYDTEVRLNNPYLAISSLVPPTGIYLVGTVDETVVGGGGFRHLEDGLAEIKRMYVVPDWRGRGLARALLHELEDRARAAGYRRARLDTGPRQPHAQQLYEHEGYHPIPAYNENPFASFWGEKDL
jgi:GNAT superfamily N-acetyltransferase